MPLEVAGEEASGAARRTELQIVRRARHCRLVDAIGMLYLSSRRRRRCTSRTLKNLRTFRRLTGPKGTSDLGLHGPAHRRQILSVATQGPVNDHVDYAPPPSVPTLHLLSDFGSIPQPCKPFQLDIVLLQLSGDVSFSLFFPMEQP